MLSGISGSSTDKLDGTACGAGVFNGSISSMGCGATLGISTLGISTVGISTFGIVTLGISTLGILL